MTWSTDALPRTRPSCWVPSSRSGDGFLFPWHLACWLRWAKMNNNHDGMKLPAKNGFGWLRRLICILGGGAAGYVVVFVSGLISMSGILDKPTNEALTRLIAIWSPAGAVGGCVIGALIVFRAERLEGN